MSLNAVHGVKPFGLFAFAITTMLGCAEILGLGVPDEGSGKDPSGAGGASGSTTSGMNGSGGTSSSGGGAGGSSSSSGAGGMGMGGMSSSSGSSSTSSGSSSSSSSSSSSGGGGMGGGMPLSCSYTNTSTGSDLFGNATELQEVTALSLNAAGEAFIGGYFSGSLNFPMHTIMTMTNEDAYVAKMSAPGACSWAKNYGDNDFSQRINDMVTATTGDLVVAGQFNGDLAFGGATMPLSISGANTNAFVAKLDGNTGDGIWSLSLGDDQTQRATGVATDAQNNTVVVGNFRGTITPPSPIATGDINNPDGTNDIFILALNSSGAGIWLKQFEDGASMANTNQQSNAIAYNGTDSVYVSGSFVGGLNFNDAAKCPPLVNMAANSHMFVAKLQVSNGSCLWNRSFGGTAGPQEGLSVSADATGHAIVAGSYNDSFIVGTKTLQNNGLSDVAIAILDNVTGDVLNAIGFGSSKNDKPEQVVFDPISNHIFVTGFFSGDMMVEGTMLTLPMANTTAAFLVELDTSLNVVCAKVYGLTSNHYGRAIAVGSGDLWLAGMGQGNIDLGGGTLAGTMPGDIWIGRFTP